MDASIFWPKYQSMTVVPLRWQSAQTRPSSQQHERQTSHIPSLKTLLESLASADPQLIAVGDLDIFTRCDYDKVMSWNQPLPTAVDACFHDLFEQIVQKSPDAPAISS